VAAASSTSPNNETVTLRLPSGEMVDAIVPAGSSDEQVKQLMRAKHPEFFSTDTASASSPPKKAPAPVRSGFLDTLGREASSLGRNVLGIPSGIYHAFADEPTAEEQTEFQGHTRIPGELGFERLTGAPLVRAGEWYRDVARGNIPNAYDQALSVAPEAVGAGASAPIAGKLIQGALGAARGAAEFTRDVSPKLGAKAVALGRGKIPAATAPRAPSAPLGPPAPDPALLQGNVLLGRPQTGAQSVAQTGEALASIPARIPARTSQLGSSTLGVLPKPEVPPLGRQPAVMTLQKMFEPPVEPPAPIQLGKRVPPLGSRADLLEDRAIDEQLRSQFDVAEQAAETAARKEFASGSAAGTPKSVLIRNLKIQRANEEFNKPVKLGKAVTSQLGKPNAAAPIPDDLTDILRKSVEQAKARKQNPGLRP
jgi:hypothetical protein